MSRDSTQKKCQRKAVVPKPNSIIIAVYGVLSGMEEQSKIVDDYVKVKLRNYLEGNWEKKEMRMVQERLIKENKLDRAVKKGLYQKIRTEGCEKEVLDSYIDYLVTRMERPLPPSSIIHKIRDWIIAQGYKECELKSHVYEDVPEVCEEWRMKLMIKLYAVAKGDPSGQRLYFKSTCFGNLTGYFNNFLMITEPRRYDPEQYAIYARLLRDDPRNLLFLTNDPDEAVAAQDSKLHSVIVNRSGETINLPPKRDFQIVTSLKEIEFEDNGRTLECC